ncbi:MAG TPA: dihydroorotase [Dehalococcoidia bacterium]|nr:dihydroorotase [Dehalococcoidia bacterium]
MLSGDLLICGGRVLDPAASLDLEAGCVLVSEGRVIRVAPSLEAKGARVLDARGMVVAPGFVDLHTHLREPGFEYKETIETGTQAAARGGFTTVCAMPNTQPPLDSRETVDFVRKRAAERGLVRVLPIGCVTKGRVGVELADLAELAAAGCVAFSDDGSPVADAGLMRRALEAARDLGLAIIDHCEAPAMSGGSMHEGWVSARLGLKGIPAASEETTVARDIALARETGSHVHIAHVSTAGSVALVREAKARGVRVTAEVTPHHLTLTHEAVLRQDVGAEPPYDTNAKMYPPLRSAEDVAACVAGLLDGTIDAIATDHAPHAQGDKSCSFEAAAFGMVGLETALALVLTRAPSIGLVRAVEALTIGPVRALGLDRFVPGAGTLRPGAPADIVVFDPAAEWQVRPGDFASRGKNTPLAGATLRGLVVATIFGGTVVFAREGVEV